MKVIIQKVSQGSVEVDEKIVGEIKEGYVILLGIKPDDTDKDIDFLVEKIANLRLFPEGEKYFEKSLVETHAQALIISQFTLYASCKKGRRPDFNEAAKGDIAKPLYEKFCERLKAQGIKVETGIFAAMMKVNLSNEGPVTIILESTRSERE